MHGGRLRMVLAQTLVLGGTLGACGGESDGNSDFDDSPDTSGSGGSVATGGSGGDSSSAASSAGGAASGGTSAGGASSASASTGGAGGSAAGASSTSASSGGSGGEGGDGGAVQNPVPPEELVDGCDQFCELEVAADCPSAPNEEDCAGGCELTTRVPACNEQLGAFFECVEQDPTSSCSNEGDVVYDGCVSEQLDAWSCIYQEAPDPGLEEPCESYCNSAQDAMCANDAGDLAGCILYCQSLGTILPECVDQWQTLLECGQDAEFECDENGDAQPVGCGVEAVLFYACVCTTSPELCTE